MSSICSIYSTISSKWHVTKEKIKMLEGVHYNNILKSYSRMKTHFIVSFIV